MRLDDPRGSVGRDVPGELRRAQKTCQNPIGNLRFQTGLGPKAGPNQAQDTRHGARKPAHNDSERCWADLGVFRRRSETFKLCDRSIENYPSGPRGQGGLLKARLRAKPVLCYAILLPGRKSAFRARFRPDSNRESFTIGVPASLRPAGGPILMLCRLKSGRNPPENAISGRDMPAQSLSLFVGPSGVLRGAPLQKNHMQKGAG